jgi:hypothetical protein
LYMISNFFSIGGCNHWDLILWIYTGYFYEKPDGKYFSLKDYPVFVLHLLNSAIKKLFWSIWMVTWNAINCIGCKQQKFISHSLDT